MKSTFVENIQSVYSEIDIDDYFFNEMGQNNDVLIVNNSFVFRFPKYSKGITQLKREKEILVYLQDKITMTVPYPIYQSLDQSELGKVFIGYKLIDGVPLSKNSLAQIEDLKVVKQLAEQLVTFLIELHSISESNVRQDLKLKARNPLEEMHHLYDKIQNKLFPYMRKDAQKEVIHAFETALNGTAFSNGEITLIHGDFGASNILWTPNTNKISGIIDFGGSGLGDPAYDFAGILSSYGQEFFDLCMKLYPNGDKISERVQFYQSTFALQEALHGIENDDKQAFEDGIENYR